MSGPRWLTHVVDGAGPVLCCVPHAGASSLGYQAWAPHLTSGAALAVAVLPGRDHRFREPPARHAAEVVAPLAEAVAAHGRPLVLFGHSMGALIAFGVTQWLRDNGFPEPLALVVSGSPAPHAPHAGGDPHLLDDDAFGETVRGLGGTPDDVLAHPVLRRRVLGLLRADFGLARSFAPAPGPVSCPVLAVHATADSWVRGMDVREWDRYTSGRFRFIEFDGDHFAPVNDSAAFVRTVEKELSGICAGYREPIC